MVKGASGLAPDFAKLDRIAISHIGAAGWVQSTSALSELSLAARAAVAMLYGAGRRTTLNSFAAEEIGAIKKAHEAALAFLRPADPATEVTVVHQHLFTHPACADAICSPLLARREK